MLRREAGHYGLRTSMAVKHLAPRRIGISKVSPSGPTNVFFLVLFIAISYPNFCFTLLIHTDYFPKR